MHLFVKIVNINLHKKVFFGGGVVLQGKESDVCSIIWGCVLGLGEGG
jgi:hypothetical protein